MDLESLGKLMLVLGVGLVLVGGAVWLGGRLGLGSLPGDVRVENEGWGCYAPVVSMLIISIVLTVVVNLIARFWNR